MTSEQKKCEELGLCPQLGSEWVRVCESFAKSRDAALTKLTASEARADALAAENARLMEGLAFYAEVRQYSAAGGDPPGTPALIMDDKGRRARALLATTQEAPADA